MLPDRVRKSGKMVGCAQVGRSQIGYMSGHDSGKTSGGTLGYDSGKASGNLLRRDSGKSIG
jgi:hypothetical protein